VPRNKTAAITWLAIYPTFTLILEVFGDTSSKLPLPLRTLVITAILVPVAVYALVPALQHVFASWPTGVGRVRRTGERCRASP
jgi:antibiotic biosynthesis monooxygenase (ABM) superfamily enzyme